MPNLVVSQFQAEDYPAALKALGQMAEAVVDRPLEMGRMYAAYGPAYTIRIDGEIAATLGVLIPWDGHGDCWAVFTPLGFRHGALIHRQIVRFLRRLIRDYKLMRLQSDVIADYQKGINLVEHLGFHLEGLMPHFGPHGETFARYAWLNPNRLTPRITATDERDERAGVTTEDGRFIPAISGGYGGETVALIMIAVTVAAAAASAYATYSASQAQEQAYKYNAKEAERQAEIAAQQTKFAAQQQAERDRRTRAAARAIQGTSGVEVGEGSSLLVDLDSAKQAELNYQAIRYQGEAQVRALQSQATLDRFQGATAARQGLIGAGASLLGGAASAGGSYAKLPSSSTPKTITVPSDSYSYGYM
jgi:hypothetical protein